jgi:hypothetical protein
MLSGPSDGRPITRSIAASGRSFFDGAVDVSQVIAKRCDWGRLFASPGNGRNQLCAQGASALIFCWLLFPAPKWSGQSQ